MTRHRAFVHLAIRTTGLVGFSLYQNGDEPRTEAQSLHDVDLGDLHAALEDPCSGTINLVDRPGHAGRASAATGGRVRAARSRRSRCLSTRFLHQLPIHALLVGERERRLLDLVNIIYTGRRMIAELQRTSSSRRRDAGYCYSLEHAEDEAAAISALVDQPIVLTADATRTRCVTQARRR